jgi:hypothetical protein
MATTTTTTYDEIIYRDGLPVFIKTNKATPTTTTTTIPPLVNITEIIINVIVDLVQFYIMFLLNKKQKQNSCHCHLKEPTLTNQGNINNLIKFIFNLSLTLINLKINKCHHQLQHLVHNNHHQHNL